MFLLNRIGMPSIVIQQKSALEHYVRDFVARFPGAAVVGHNELAAKACPSFDVQAWLRETGIL